MRFTLGFLSGIAAASGALACTKSIFSDRNKPPWISEYYVRSIWLETAGFYETLPNPVFAENNAKADIVIIGGGLTGLASAYHLSKGFPHKRIVLLEAARCGYGASGRNGGILQGFDNTLIMELYQKHGLEAARRYLEIDRQGPLLMHALIKEHQIDCDLEKSGLVELALDAEEMQTLVQYEKKWRTLGIEARLLNQDEIKQKLNSEMYCGGLRKDDCANLNPAKYALGLKAVVEDLGVEIYECTKVVSVQAGGQVQLDTEFGSLTAGAAVLATNAYSHKLGYFKKRLFPIGAYIMATEPLNAQNLSAIGWEGRETMFDIRREKYYFRLTSENRIVIGGGLSPYFYGNQISSGNYNPAFRQLERGFYKIWPQLEDVQITHKWGGTLGMTFDFHPTIGVMEDNRNIYYAVGYSGHGVSWSQLAGKIIAQLYAAEDTELTRFYCVNKTPPYLPPEPFRKIGYHLYSKFLL